MQLDQLRGTKQLPTIALLSTAKGFGAPKTEAGRALGSLVSENTTVAKAAVLFQIVCARGLFLRFRLLSERIAHTFVAAKMVRELEHKKISAVCRNWTFRADATPYFWARRLFQCATMLLHSLKLR